MPTVGSSPHISLSANDCGDDDGCSYTTRQRLEESSYIVKVAASNFVGVGESTTCQGQIGMYYVLLVQIVEISFKFVLGYSLALM